MEWKDILRPYQLYRRVFQWLKWIPTLQEYWWLHQSKFQIQSKQLTTSNSQSNLWCKQEEVFFFFHLFHFSKLANLHIRSSWKALPMQFEQPKYHRLYKAKYQQKKFSMFTQDGSSKNDLYFSRSSRSLNLSMRRILTTIPPRFGIRIAMKIWKYFESNILSFPMFNCNLFKKKLAEFYNLILLKAWFRLMREKTFLFEISRLSLTQIYMIFDDV